MAKFADHMGKIAEGVTEGYKKIEDGVVDGFTSMTDKVSGAILNEDGSMKTGKIGEAVVGAYEKVENAFVNTFMAKEGESVEDAKARIAADQQARQEQMKADAEKRVADQQPMIESSLEAAKNAGKIDR